jgi:2-polyprenyl-6-methoxyphenol hydroxylase-like FAD-dependent oxidoreductase
VRVDIVGAGIAGLAAAVTFARRGADVVIYERPGSAGAGISLLGNGVEASRQVGRIAQAHSPMAVALRNSLLRLLPVGASTRAAARLQAWRPPGPDTDP